MIKWSGKAFIQQETVKEDDKTITKKGYYQAVGTDFILYGGIGYKTYSKNKFGKKLRRLGITKRGLNVMVNPDINGVCIADMTLKAKPNG